MSKKSLLATATLGLALLSAPAMAQEVEETPSAIEFEVSNQFDYTIQPQMHMTDLAFNTYAYNKIGGDEYVEESTYDWQAESSLYKKVGWGLFGGGLGLEVVGFVIYVVGITGSAVDGNADGVVWSAITGYSLMAIGSLAFLAGCGVLIAEAVKFAPYKTGQIAGNKFQWRPSIVATPEYQGFGLDFRF